MQESSVGLDWLKVGGGGFWNLLHEIAASVWEANGAGDVLEMKRVKVQANLTMTMVHPSDFVS